MKHSFDTDIAEVLGIEAAVLLFNLEFWLKKNQANERHFYDGRYWTYNSVKAWQELFPYMTKDVIRKRLDLLAQKGVLLKGSFSSDRRDRTAWYTINIDQLHLVTQPNAIVLPAKSSLCTDIKPTDHKQVTDFPFELFWNKYDKKTGRVKAESLWDKINEDTRAKIMAHLELYSQKEKQFRKDPERYLKHKSWEDEVVLDKSLQKEAHKKLSYSPLADMDRFKKYERDDKG